MALSIQRTRPEAARAYRLRQRGSGPAVLLTFFICCAGMFAAMQPSPDPDSWWHLATGRWIIDSGNIPRADPFSWTASGKAWIAHEWGSEIIFYSIDSSFGPMGLLVMQGLFIGIGLFVFRRTLRRVVDNEWVVAIALGAALYLGSLMWSLRPHLISFVLVSIFLDTLVAFRAGDAERRVWSLVPLTVMWANLHAGFLTGVLLVWIFALVGIAERRHDARRLLGIAVLVAAGGTLNPAGPEIYAFSVYLARVSYRVAEWQPPGIRDPLSFVMTALVLGTPALLAWTRRRCDPALLATAVAFGFLALGAIRNIWLAGLLVTPAFAVGLVGLRRLPQPSIPTSRDVWVMRVVSVLVVVGGATAVGLDLAGRSQSWLRGEGPFPKRAAEYLAVQDPGRVVNPYHWGGYLIWKVPDFPVSADGRADLYGDELLGDVGRLEQLEPGWRVYLERNMVRYVLWERDHPLTQVLKVVDGWNLIYQDSEAAIFVME